MIHAQLFGGARDGDVVPVPLPLPRVLVLSDELDCPLRPGADLTRVDVYELDPLHEWPANVVYRLAKPV